MTKRSDGEAQERVGEKEPRYIIVTNLRADMVVIPPFLQYRVDGHVPPDIVLGPLESQAVPFSLWDGDTNLLKMRDAGYVAISTGNAPPKPKPPLPEVVNQLTADDFVVVQDIVMGNPSLARATIMMTPKVGQSRTEVDIPRLKDRHRRILSAAAAWLKAWDMHEDRQEMIKSQLRTIDAM